MYTTLIVVDNDDISTPQKSPAATDADKAGFELAGIELADLEIISFETYLRDYPKHNEPKTRIINLCDTGHYLSKGYYCSLLAEARHHIVLPSVKTINELRNLKLGDEDLASYQGELSEFKLSDNSSAQWLAFGKTDVAELKSLAGKLFKQYPAPLLQLHFSHENGRPALQVQHASFSRMESQQRKSFVAQLKEYTQTVWRIGNSKKRYRWDMAILVDPEDKVPPSNKEAIARFVKAAAKHGIQADVVTKDTLTQLNTYDALFIRETTAIDHHTYRLANKAEKKGLIVMDDPASILRCCNKVYLHDAFTYQNVPSLKTKIISDAGEASLALLESNFTYPLILKMPEGSFSIGVYKVNTRQELEQRLEELFAKSALVLAQEYLYTEFDWRIGVLNGRALYACRYLMARNHWQIYNHGAKRFFSGDFETLPTFEVPKYVLDAALKAAQTVGNGLYGIDIKAVDNKAYVLEVNDNPSIDHKIEDAYLGDELYMQIMGEFKRRLEARGH